MRSPTHDMTAAAMVRQARAQAGLSQRGLAAVSDVPQAVIARLEGAVVDPRFSTVNRLLRACHVELVVMTTAGAVDRSHIRWMLSLSKEERARTFLESNRRTLAFLARARRTAQPTV